MNNKTKINVGNINNKNGNVFIGTFHIENSFNESRSIEQKPALQNDNLSLLGNVPPRANTLPPYAYIHNAWSVGNVVMNGLSGIQYHTTRIPHRILTFAGLFWA